MRVLGQRSCRSFVTCLMTVLTSVPFLRGARRAKDHGDWCAALYVIDVHRREAALALTLTRTNPPALNLVDSLSAQG
jgi:hypothetical protein